jgi:hypothetical protein
MDKAKSGGFYSKSLQSKARGYLLCCISKRETLLISLKVIYNII